MIGGQAVPVTGGPGVSAEAVAAAVASVPFKDWAAGMDANLIVSSVRIQGVDFFGERVGFIKFATATTFHGHRMPGLVFMRGGAVAILVVLRCGGEAWALCCRQPRVPIGASSFLEIPAGMLDGSGHFAGVAAKEMKEETGLEIDDGALFDLTAAVYDGADGAAPARGMYPSAGACDEFLRLLYYAKEVSAEELAGLRGKATGCIEEGEAITLDVVRLDQLWRLAPDAKTLCAILLAEKLAAAGRLPYVTDPPKPSS